MTGNLKITISAALLIDIYLCRGTSTILAQQPDSRSFFGAGITVSTKKNESYAKQANKKRKEVVLEPGDDPRHLRANVFQEGGNDENPETSQIQAKGPSGEGQSPRVEKDEGPSGEGRRPKWRKTKAPSGEG